MTDDTGRHVLAYLDQQEEALTRQARDFLTEVAEPLRKGPTPIDVQIDVRIGDPASGIALAALDTQADLIVMATHGRTGVQRAMLGSVAGAVLRTACTPVVLVRPTLAPPPGQGDRRARGGEVRTHSNVLMRHGSHPRGWCRYSRGGSRELYQRVWHSPARRRML